MRIHILICGHESSFHYHLVFLTGTGLLLPPATGLLATPQQTLLIQVKPGKQGSVPVKQGPMLDWPTGQPADGAPAGQQIPPMQFGAEGKLVQALFEQRPGEVPPFGQAGQHNVPKQV
jgi:hypothetical protein